VQQPGHADDARPRLLLWRPGGTQERARHHDSKLRLHGLDDGDLVSLRLFSLLQRRLARDHRQLRQRIPARNQPEHALAKRHHPGICLHRLSNDVRHYHSRAHLRRVHQSGHVQGVHAFPYRMADLRLFPFRPHGLGWRHAPEVGRARFRRRHRGAQHRRHCRSGLRAVCRQAPHRRPRPTQHSAGRARNRPALVRMVRL